MSITIIIDSREKDYFREALFTQGVKYVTQTLDVGDIAFAIDNNIISIIERKQISDLLSSIIDGRRHDQIFRLRDGVKNKSGQDIKIYYLIEGDINSDTKASQAYIDTIFKYGIPAILTHDANDTVQRIIEIQKCYERGFDIVHHKDLYETSTPDALSDIIEFKPHELTRSETLMHSNSHLKRKCNEKGDVFLGILMMVPKIGEKTAMKIKTQYKCIRELMDDISKGIPVKGASKSVNESLKKIFF
jgi:ERCC4-type nuclease